MRARLRRSLALIVIAGVVAAVVLISSDRLRRDRRQSGTILAWDEPPLAIRPPDLPDDRIAYGTVRNTSLESLNAATKDFEVRDADGKQLEASRPVPRLLRPRPLRRLSEAPPAPRRGADATRLPGRPRQRPDLAPDGQLPARRRQRMPATLYYLDAPALDLPDDE